MALIFCPPEGHRFEKKTIGLDSFAKAKGLRFEPWKLVKCDSDRQEQQIASYCREHGGFPLVVMDWTNEQLVEEYFKRNPNEVPETRAGMAALMAKMQAPPDHGKAIEGKAIDKIPPTKVTHELCSPANVERKLKAGKGPVAQAAEQVVLEA